MIVATVRRSVWTTMKLELASGTGALCALAAANALGLSGTAVNAFNLLFFAAMIVFIGALVTALIRLWPPKVLKR